MSGKVPFTYSILRYSHDVISGERVNVGVVICSPQTRKIAFRFNKRYGRLRSLFPDLDGKAFQSSIRSIENSLDFNRKRYASLLMEQFETSQNFVEKTLRMDDSSFSWGKVGSGLSSDLDSELNQLFIRFVTWHEDYKTEKRTDSDIWRPVREALTQRNMDKILQSHIVESEHTRVKFDHTFQNGALHCYQPLSFELSTEQSIHDKVARWSGHLYHLEDHNLRPYFIVARPRESHLKDAYHSAIAALQDSPKNPSIFREEERDKFIDTIEDVINANNSQRSILH